MNIITVDAGNYSVKFLHGKLEQKKLNIFDNHEVVIESVRSQFPEDASLEEIQHTIIHQYIEQANFDGRLVFQFPSTSLTTRFLDLPVSNKKKADMMIPFQLDENLPYPVSKAHFAKSLIKRNGHYKSSVYVSELEYFDTYYESLKFHKIIPAILTTEHSIIQSYIDLKKLEGNFCILDIGHQTAKAYFFNAQDMVASHISFTAGAQIDEVISETYQISRDEAVNYKHENCFLLTSEQLEQVEEDQAEFAKLMRTTFSALVHDMNRWMLGYRLNYGQPVEKVFITGGSSNITNIENFLISELGTPVEVLPHKNLARQVGEDNAHSFGLSYMMSMSQQSKLNPVNFLTKEYASSTSAGINLHSSTFVVSRVLAFSLLLIILLIGEKQILLNHTERYLDRVILKELKDRNLELKRSVSSLYRKKPETVYKQIKNKESSMKQEINSIMAATKVDAISPLLSLSNAVSRNDLIDLINFTSDSFSSEAIFKSEEIRELEVLVKQLEKSDLKNLKLNLKKKTLLLEVKFDN